MSAGRSELERALLAADREIAQRLAVPRESLIPRDVLDGEHGSAAGADRAPIDEHRRAIADEVRRSRF